MEERLTEIHEFLSVLRDAFSRLRVLRAGISSARGDIGDNDTQTGQTGNWGGSPGGDTYVHLGTWAVKPDSSSVIWGISLRTTPTYFEVDADITFERDPEIRVVLWSQVSTHDDVAEAREAIAQAAEQLVIRASLISEIDKEHS